jgi:hypothetical protein
VDLSLKALTLAPETPDHACEIVPAPKMDSQGLVAAVCSCGRYRSGSTTEHSARKSWQAHADAKTAHALVLRPDAREQIARWLWIQDTGSDSAWPHAGETLRRPFLEAAEQILSVIAVPRDE